MSFLSLRVASVERIIAEQVLKMYNENMVVSFDAIIERENISFKEMPDVKSDNARGQFLASGPDGCPTIYLDTKKQSLTSQRFTLAHELGHYFLHHGSCVRDTYEVMTSNNSKERSANNFASELLLPTKEIIKYRRYYRYSVERIAERFGTSVEYAHKILSNRKMI